MTSFFAKFLGTGENNKNRAIHSYQQTSTYGNINPYLRGFGNERVKNKTLNRLTRNINSVIDQSGKGTGNIYVYRGIPVKYIKAGENFINRAYTSTTTNINEAKKYGTAVIRIKVPKNIKRHIMKNQREKEILIERGTVLKNIRLRGRLGNNHLLFNANLEKMNNKKIPRPKNTPLASYFNLQPGSNNESSNFNNN